MNSIDHVIMAVIFMSSWKLPWPLTEMSWNVGTGYAPTVEYCCAESCAKCVLHMYDQMIIWTTCIILNFVFLSEEVKGHWCPHIFSSFVSLVTSAGASLKFWSSFIQISESFPSWRSQHSSPLLASLRDLLSKPAQVLCVASQMLQSSLFSVRRCPLCYIVSSDRSSYSDVLYIYLSIQQLFRFSLSPLMQLILQLSL